MTAKDHSEKQFASMLGQLHANGAYSDLKIVCGSITYNVHKAIVCPQSDFFRAACRPDTFLEGKTSIINSPASSGRDDEFFTRPISIEEFDLELDVQTTQSVKHMVHYFYHHDYHAEEAYTDHRARFFAPENRKGILSEHSRMYAMGDKYGVPGLKTVAQAKFQSLLDICSHGGLATAIIIAYKTTPENDRGLRAVILSTLDRWRMLYGDNEELQQIIFRIPEISYDLYRRMFEREKECRGESRRYAE